MNTGVFPAMQDKMLAHDKVICRKSLELSKFSRLSLLYSRIFFNVMTNLDLIL